MPSLRLSLSSFSLMVFPNLVKRSLPLKILGLKTFGSRFYFYSCFIILASLRTSAKDLSANDPSLGLDISSNYSSNSY